MPSEFDSGLQQEEFNIQATTDEGYASHSAAISSSTPADPGSASIQDFLGQDCNVSSDHYIGLYYQHFHHLHPCVLPRKHLGKMLENPSNHPRLELLLSVMRSIGTSYSPFSERRQDRIVHRISSGIDPVQDAFSVQSLLLNSIALYWCGQEESSREEMDHAISIALTISMHSCTFATAHGLGNPVLEESWRRTWWQLCIVDAYYAASLHQTSPLMCRPDVTTDLPCEESEYEAVVCLPLNLGLPITATMATDPGDRRSFLSQENSTISTTENLAMNQTSFHHSHILWKFSELLPVRWKADLKLC
jgi:hypothetical protein